jgi:maltooligosyltrehalose trehalohydrolase
MAFCCSVDSRVTISLAPRPLGQAPSQAATLGARMLGGGRCRFAVWAPLARTVELHLLGPEDRLVPLAADTCGYHTAKVDGVGAGVRYRYRLDGGRELPDPASRAQPDGVHGPSAVVDRDFRWTDAAWRGLALEQLVIYELHVGTFTPDGTFDAIAPHLTRLHDFGVTAIELMPVCPFPGSRNWGYDGVFPFAVHSAYGGPEGLKRLVDACHRQDLAVVLDVVHNHLGPEGNHLHSFAPYFTDRHRTPWGEGLNFDGPGSDEVRRFFVESALAWVDDYHVDALRADAVDAIFDPTPAPFVAELVAAVHRRAAEHHRSVHVIAESSANDPRTVRSPKLGGWGFDAQWDDDFHHAVHTLLTPDRGGYYQDYGSLGQLARCFREGWTYAGDRSAYRGRRHGAPPTGIPAKRFVVFSQNHDLVGNRAAGDRLVVQAGREAAKLAAALVILSPFLPHLFMGEEYGEDAPFPYFVSHTDPAVVEAVRRGRRRELAALASHGDVPDPQSEATFASARLHHELANEPGHREIVALYRELLRLRREVPALAHLSRDSLDTTVIDRPRVLVVRRWTGADEAALVANFEAERRTVAVPLPPGSWRVLLDTAASEWAGPGSRVSLEVESDGEATLSLAPSSLVLLHRRAACQAEP